MLNLLLSILFSVALLLLFRLFSRYGVRPFQAIAFNYLTCVGFGAFFLPERPFLPPPPVFPLLLTLLLGCCFLLSFNLTSLSVRRAGVAVTSLAVNLSLVVPVLVSLLWLGSAGKPLGGANYAGLGLALVAVGLVSVKPQRRSSARRPEVGATAWLPLLVFGMNGLINSLTNFLTRRAVFAETVFTWLAFAGAAGAATLAFGQQWLQGRERLHGRSLLGGVVLGVSNYLSYLFLVNALRDFGGNGALLFPLYNLGTILLATTLGVVGFGERLSLVNKLGLGLAVGALGLLMR
jgi:drug/metabolite transporter (DMT)-like permease